MARSAARGSSGSTVLRFYGSGSWVRCSTKRQPNRPLMHRLPAVIGLSSGDVAFTISPSCTCRVSVQPTPQYGQIVSVVVCRDGSHAPRRAQLVLAAGHQRAGRTHGDAVAAVDARRVRQGDGELRRDVRAESAAGDRDRERVLVIRARTLRHTCSRARTCRSRGRRGRCRSSPAARPWPRRRTEALRPAAVLLEQVRPVPGAVDRSTDEARSSSTSRRARITRGDRVWTIMPASTAREQLGTSTRAPSTSTTQRRQTLTGFSVSRKHSVGYREADRRAGREDRRALGHADGAAVDGERDGRRLGARRTADRDQRDGADMVRLRPRRRASAA